MTPNAIRQNRGIVLAIALGAALAFPHGALASHQFADVPDSNPFHDDIDALAQNGVTSGCGGGNYCPQAFVTREQMASFLNRLGALGPGTTPVVDAALLGGFNKNNFGPWLGAVVDENGTLVRGYNVLSATRQQEGQYEVIFGQNVSQCTYAVSIGEPGTGQAPSGVISAQSLFQNPNGVYVASHNVSGVPLDRPFHLNVRCQGD